MPAWDAEDAFDAFLIADADLNVGFAAEAGRGVERFAFSEGGANGVEGFLTRDFAGLTQVVDYHAIQFSEKKVFAA